MCTSGPPSVIAFPDTEPKWRLFLKKWWVLLLAVGLMCGYSPVFLRHLDDSQWNIYVKAARRMHARESINVIENDTYAYPPAMALVSMPLAFFSTEVSHPIWYAINIAAVIVTFVAAWRMAGGPPLAGLRGPWAVILVITLFAAGRHMVSPLENRQFDMVIAAFLMLGCLLLWRGRDRLAGASLGAAAAMKFTPLLFAGYLLWRRKPAAAAIMLSVVAALNLTPDVLFPKADGGSYLNDWRTRILARIERQPPGQWLVRTPQVLNQSLGGLMHRHATLGFPLSPEQLKKKHPRLTSPAVERLRMTVYGTALAIGLASAWAMRKPWQAGEVVEADRGPVPLGSIRTAMECSIVMCLMLLVSPMSSKAHYTPMLLPTLVLVRHAVELRGRWIWFVALLAITGPLTAKGLLGRDWGLLALAWGIPIWYVLISLAGMWIVLRRLDRAAETETAATDVPIDRPRLRAA